MQYLTIPKISFDGQISYVVLEFDDISKKDSFLAKYVQLAEEISLK
jgi:hypothetical protein